MDTFNEFLQDKLKHRDSAGLLRELPPIQEKHRQKIKANNKWLIDFASNDYLGLAQMPINCKTRASGASRLLSGNRQMYQATEQALADYRKKESCLFFSSGYAANISVISAIADKKDALFIDKLSHASIIDGALFSGARIFRFRHNSTEHLASLIKKHRKNYRNALIITESLFSMNGDFSPIEEIKTIAKQYNCWLYIDEAHSVGVWDIDTYGIDILVGTFGKAFGLWGAYVCGSKSLIQYLINYARSFVFSTAMPEMLFSEINKKIPILIKGTKKERLKKNVSFAINLLCPFLPKGHSSQILPVIFGQPQNALSASKYLRKNGIFAPAIRPPTVEPNKSIIRLSLSAMHSRADIQKLADIITRLKNNEK